MTLRIRLLLLGLVVLVSAPAPAALVPARGVRVRTFALGCARLEATAPRGRFLDEFLVWQVLHRRFVADLRDFALG
jgi:hypothetical protein